MKRNLQTDEELNLNKTQIITIENENKTENISTTSSTTVKLNNKSEIEELISNYDKDSNTINITTIQNIANISDSTGHFHGENKEANHESKYSLI